MTKSFDPKLLTGSYLITGISGSGKTTVGQELKRLGYSTIEGDDHLGQFVNERDETVSIPLENQQQTGWDEGLLWVYRRNDLLRILSSSSNHTFIIGNGDNEHEYLSSFDKVFCLKTTPVTLIGRLADPSRRHGYGSNEYDRKKILGLFGRYYANMETAGVTLVDAEQPLNDVIQHILTEVHA